VLEPFSRGRSSTVGRPDQAGEQYPHRHGTAGVVVGGDGHPDQHGDVVGGDAGVQATDIIQSGGQRFDEVGDEALRVRTGAWADRRQPQKCLRVGVRQIATVGEHRLKRFQWVGDIAG